MHRLRSLVEASIADHLDHFLDTTTRELYYSFDFQQSRRNKLIPGKHAAYSFPFDRGSEQSGSGQDRDTDILEQRILLFYLSL